ncbi:MAG: Cupin 2 [Blastococcus sp.]|nr:Cupin 2 [Blastococcus sp.]
MSFPPATSPAMGSGDGFVLGPDEGQAYWWLGTLTINKVTREATRGALDIVDHRVPAGYAPPRHVHRDQDEVFFVLEGTFAVRCGEQEWQAGPGAVVFLPRQVPHGFTVSQDGPARTLLINAPAGFADVITELGQATGHLVLPGPNVPMPDPERIAGVSQAHGIYGA